MLLLLLGGDRGRHKVKQKQAELPQLGARAQGCCGSISEASPLCLQGLQSGVGLALGYVKIWGYDAVNGLVIWIWDYIGLFVFLFSRLFSDPLSAGAGSGPGTHLHHAAAG